MPGVKRLRVTVDGTPVDVPALARRRRRGRLHRVRPVGGLGLERAVRPARRPGRHAGQRRRGPDQRAPSGRCRLGLRSIAVDLLGQHVAGVSGDGRSGGRVRPGRRAGPGRQPRRRPDGLRRRHRRAPAGLRPLRPAVARRPHRGGRPAVRGAGRHRAHGRRARGHRRRRRHVRRSPATAPGWCPWCAATAGTGCSSSRVRRDEKGRVLGVGPAPARPRPGHRPGRATSPGGPRRPWRCWSRRRRRRLAGRGRQGRRLVERHEPEHRPGAVPRPGPPGWSPPRRGARRCSSRPATTGCYSLSRTGRWRRSVIEPGLRVADLRRLSRPVPLHSRSARLGRPQAAPRWARRRGAVRHGGGMSRTATFRDAGRDLLLGTACVGCGGPGRLLCAACDVALPRRGRPAWPTPVAAPGWPRRSRPVSTTGCSRRWSTSTRSTPRSRSPAPLGRVLGDVVEDLLRALGGGHPTGPVSLVPVPSRPSGRPAARPRPDAPRHAGGGGRLRRRGVDAAVRRLLVSTGPVRDQAALGAAERAANLRRVRCAADAVPARRRASLLVVDDVLTTGSTAREAQRALEHGGAAGGPASRGGGGAPGRRSIRGVPYRSRRSGRLTSVYGVRPGPWLRRRSAAREGGRSPDRPVRSPSLEPASRCQSQAKRST